MSGIQMLMHTVLYKVSGIFAAIFACLASILHTRSPAFRYFQGSSPFLYSRSLSYPI